MIHPFTAEELKTYNRLSWKEQWMARHNRRKKLFDCYMNDKPYVPDLSPGLIGGGVQGWEESLESTIADGTQVSNITAETIIVPDFNIPAYYMAPGRTLRVWASGVLSNVVTTPGTLIMAIRWGGVGGVMLSQSAAMALDTTAHTNTSWCLYCYIVCRSAGATGTFMSMGVVNNPNTLTTTAANLVSTMMCSTGTPLSTNSNVVSAACNTTIANLLSMTAKFSLSTSPTNLTCQQRIIEVLN